MILALGGCRRARGRAPAGVPVGAAGRRAGLLCAGAADAGRRARRRLRPLPGRRRGRGRRSCSPGVAAWAAAAQGSAICALIARDRGRASRVLAFVDWVFDPARLTTVPLAAGRCSRSRSCSSRCVARARRRGTPSRWSTRPAWRCSRSALTGSWAAIFDSFSPFGRGGDAAAHGWELVVLAAGCGLIAYGAVDRAPGPAWLGVANLPPSSSRGGDRRRRDAARAGRCCCSCSALGAMVAGLRPREPLPPEPRAYTTGDASPLAARSAEDDRRARARRLAPAAMTDSQHVQDALDRAYAGGPERHHEKSGEQGKLLVRERMARLLDDGSLRRGRAARQLGGRRPARRRRGHRHRARSTAGRSRSWPTTRRSRRARGARARSRRSCASRSAALAHRVPMVYLVDSAGARITDQIDMFPGRRGAGRIFYNQVRLSGAVPQVCLLFGPSAAGGAYIPAFCDVVIMVDGNASMYLGSPRMAEMVIGEKVTLEEMGGAQDALPASRAAATSSSRPTRRAIDAARRYLALLPAATATTSRRPRRRAAPSRGRARSRADPRRREQALRHARADRRARRRGLVLRGQQALCARS